MDLTPLLSQDALAPFAEEISGRQKRRERRADQETRAAEREAAAAADAAAAAASKGLSAQELKVSLLDRSQQQRNTDTRCHLRLGCVMQAYMYSKASQCALQLSDQHANFVCVSVLGGPHRV